MTIFGDFIDDHNPRHLNLSLRLCSFAPLR